MGGLCVYVFLLCLCSGCFGLVWWWLVEISWLGGDCFLNFEVMCFGVVVRVGCKVCRVLLFGFGG